MSQCYDLRRHASHISFSSSSCIVHASHCQEIIYSENLARHKSKQLEQERWRTLAKIRCITQVVLLWFSSCNSIKQPPGKILGWDTKHSYEEKERREKKSTISFSKVSGRKKCRNRNQLDVFWRLSNNVQKREIMQGNKGPGNKTKIHESADMILT